MYSRIQKVCEKENKWDFENTLYLLKYVINIMFRHLKTSSILRAHIILQPCHVHITKFNDLCITSFAHNNNKFCKMNQKSNIFIFCHKPAEHILNCFVPRKKKERKVKMSNKNTFYISVDANLIWNPINFLNSKTTVRNLPHSVLT